MKATEFRIGNFLIVDHEIVSVNEIRQNFEDEEHYLCVQYDNGMFADFNLDEIQRVPISEEWLLKFGFEKHGEWFILDDSKMPANMSINISLIHKKTIIGSNEGYEIQNIKYVHQLQNLYFALTGEELKIK